MKHASAHQKNLAKALVILGALNWGYVGVRRIIDKDDKDKTHNPRDFFALFADNDKDSPYDTNTTVHWIQVIVYLLVAVAALSLLVQQKKK